MTKKSKYTKIQVSLLETQKELFELVRGWRNDGKIPNEIAWVFMKIGQRLRNHADDIGELTGNGVCRTDFQVYWDDPKCKEEYPWAFPTAAEELTMRIIAECAEKAEQEKRDKREARKAKRERRKS